MTSTFVRQTRLLPFSLGWIKLLIIGIVLFAFIRDANCTTEPTESECRPYIEKALKEQHLEEEIEIKKGPNQSVENPEDTNEEIQKKDDGNLDNNEDGDEDVAVENEDDHDREKRQIDDDDDDREEDGENEKSVEIENENESVENEIATENNDENDDDDDDAEDKSNENKQNSGKSTDKSETAEEKHHDKAIDTQDNSDSTEPEGLENNKGNEEEIEKESNEDLEHPIEVEMQEIKLDDEEDDDKGDDDDDDVDEEDKDKDKDDVNADGNNSDVKLGKEEDDDNKTVENIKVEMKYKTIEKDEKHFNGEKQTVESSESEEIKVEPKTQEGTDEIEDKDQKEEETSKISLPTASTGDDGDKISLENETEIESKIKNEVSGTENVQDKHEESSVPEEELTQKVVIPQNLRPRDHIYKILKLDERDSKSEKILEKTTDTTLKSLKSLYDNAIKPLEMLYKYRDLSNRHFGDPEIFSKPLILFMGPWSGGKSSTINYLLDNEFAHTSLRTGAEPSPAYFNILMYGEEEEILDGTQLAADWTFSGLQKFGQSLLDRLKGVKLPNKLLEKVNIVEIPGILEIRKQVQRLFPFNDACQWFIDRADIIFLVYDPSKLDVGPETEAILDQLKGRESQTRIILNKADQVKPEELMRVQGTLIWNISPLMSSSEPPVMYSTSLWSMPFETGAPTRLLMAQERAFLKDLREAIDKRVENKISSARRFAVRVRNHAKMVDCYLTTYYNHKSFFGNRKRISDDIIEHPQKYHIYEGLSTLTNISRYDLPDPDVYQDFFKINPLYEFKKLSETCTYFRGCPINKLDIVIAYDLPELIGKYRKAVETVKEQLQKENS